MKVRLIKYPEVIGTSNKFNELTLNEVIVNFSTAGMGSDSMYIKDLEIFITKNLQFLLNRGGIQEWTPVGHWIPMSDAFKNNDLITDNYNTEFFEPKDDEERKRGYRLTDHDLSRLKAESFD